MDELYRQLQAIDAQIDAVLAHDELTPEQKTEHDRLLEERKKLNRKISIEQDRLTRESERRRIERSSALLAEQRANEEQAARDDETRRQAAALVRQQAQTEETRIAAERAARALPRPTASTADLPTGTTPTAVTPTLAGAGIDIIPSGIPAEFRRHAPVIYFRDRPGQTRSKEERAYRFGMYCMAKLANDVPSRYRFPQATEFVQRQMAAVGDHGADGHQYLIPEEFGQDLVDLREYFGVFRRITRVMPMSSDTRVDPRRVSGLTAYFYTMNDAINESNKSWDDVRLTAKDLAVISRVSNQVRMDMVINWGDDLAKEIAYAFAHTEDQCGFIGDGSSTYGHIVGLTKKLQDCDNAGTASAGLKVQGTGSTWGALVLADFEAVVGLLPQYADVPGQVGWVCHKTFFNNVMLRLLLASGGTMAYEVMEGFPNPVPKFLGYPVWFSQVMPAVTATDTVSALLGNYKLGSRLGDRQQDTISFSEHASVGGQSLWERNQLGIRGTQRFDINNHDCGTASIVGPIVGLATFH